MTHRLPIYVAVFLFSVLAGFVYFSNTRFFRPLPDGHLTVSVADIPVFGLIFIADTNGYFIDEGLDIKLHRFLLGKEALDDMLKGNSDLATVYDTPFTIRAYEGADVRGLTTLHTSTRNTALVAAKDKGINSISDISGKTIGVSKGTNAEFFLNLLLISEGIELGNVKIIDVKPENMTDDLLNGRVDAIVAWNPYLYRAQQMRPQDFTVFYSDIYSETSLLAVKGSSLPVNHGLYEKFLRALLRAEDYYVSHHDESMSIVARALPDLSNEEINNTWGDINLSLRLNNTLYTSLERELMWIKENNPNDQHVQDMRYFLYPDILTKLKPQAVTIF